MKVEEVLMGSELDSILIELLGIIFNFNSVNVQTFRDQLKCNLSWILYLFILKKSLRARSKNCLRVDVIFESLTNFLFNIFFKVCDW